MYNFLKIARAAAWKLPNTERMSELDFAEVCGLPPAGFRNGPVTEYAASAMVVRAYENGGFHGIERLICRMDFGLSVFEEISYSNVREKLYVAADEIRSSVGWERFAELLGDLWETRFPKTEAEFLRKLVPDERSRIRQTIENIADFYGESALGYVLFAAGVSDLARSNAMRFGLCAKRRDLDLRDEFLKRRLEPTVRFLSGNYPGYYRLPDRLGFAFAMRKACWPYSKAFSEASLAAIGGKPDHEFYASSIRAVIEECWIRRAYCGLFEAGVPETVFLREVEDVAAKAYVSFGGNLLGICEHIRKNHFPDFATGKATSDVPASALFRRLTDLLDAMKTRSPDEFEKFSHWLFWKSGYDIQWNPTVNSRENVITNHAATMATKDKKDYTAEFVAEKLAKKGYSFMRLTASKFAKDKDFAETREALEDGVFNGVCDYVSVALSVSTEDENESNRSYLVVTDDDAYSGIKEAVSNGCSGTVRGAYITEKAALRAIVEKFDLVDVTDFDLEFSVGDEVVRVGSNGEAVEITSVSGIRYDKYRKAPVYVLASRTDAYGPELRKYSKPAKK